MRLRRARPADVPALVQIERESFRTDPFSERQFRYLVTRAKGVVWVAHATGVVQGFVIVLAPSRWRAARIYDVAIAKTARGQGLGRLLLERAWTWARRQGRRKLILEVEQTNRSAIRLYERLGFVRDKRLSGYYGRGRDGWRYVYAQ